MPLKLTVFRGLPTSAMFYLKTVQHQSSWTPATLVQHWGLYYKTFYGRNYGF
jgi:hypothetical protein